MRAVGFSNPGGPEVLEVIERQVREPRAEEVRIAVKAAAVNPTDIGMRQHGGGDTSPPWTPGMDAAGIIESVGESVGDGEGDGVQRLTLGQEVMAAVSPRRPEGGAQAELLVVPAASVVPIPPGATFAQASTLPMNGLTAELGLEMLGLEAGQTLGVSGGAGLLASYVIPIAKRDGLRVLADAKHEDETLVRSFGADGILPRGDHFVQAVRESVPEGVDGLYDTALLGRAAFGAVRNGGGFAVVRGWDDSEPDRGIKVHQVRVVEALERTEWLEDLRQLAGEGRIQLRVAAEFPPERAAEAQELMDAGGIRGRAVITF